MGHWLAVELDQDGPNHDAIGAWIAVRGRRDRREREVTVGGGHASGQLGRSTSASAAPRPSGESDVAGRRGRAVAAGRGRPGRAASSAGDGRPSSRHEHRTRMTDARGRARLAEVDAAGLRPTDDDPGAPGGALRGSARALARADGASAATTASSSTPTASTAPTSPCLTGFDPRFEEALLIVGAATATRPSWSATSAYGMAGAAPLPMRRHPLPGPQPARPATRPVAAAAEILGRRGHRRRGAGRRRRLEAVRRPASMLDVPVLPRRRAARDRRRARGGRERERPAHRPGRRPAGRQRGRAARGDGGRRVHDVERRALACSAVCGPACASGRRSRSSAGTARRCRAT